MRYNYKRVYDYEVEKWLFDKIPELTKYQKECIRNDEIIRFAPFSFYKRAKRVKNIFIRLSVIPLLLIWLILFIWIPFNYIITGEWGYNKINWFTKWWAACGLR